MDKSQEGVIQDVLILGILKYITLIAAVSYDLKPVLMAGPGVSQAILYAEWAGCLTQSNNLIFSHKWSKARLPEI